MHRACFPLVLSAAWMTLPAVAGSQTFTCNTAQAGTQLNATAIYRSGATFGFDQNTTPASFDGKACSSQRPFFFSVAEPDGDYRVTLTLGGPKASTITVKGEARRLFLNQLVLATGETKTISFNVQVRTKQMAGSDLSVKLKPREVGAADWDEKLTLEFDGTPSVQRIAIEPTSVPVIYLAGDSTVVDQDNEPWAAWGQMLPAFVTDKASVGNHAESGETIRSFVEERRLAKIESMWKRGDYLLIQFAHNDQKPGPGNVPVATQYKELLRKYIADARAAGVTPILVTSMNRRSFDAEGHIQETLGEYPQAMRDTSQEQHVALIDLNRMSKTLYEALGPEGTLKAFVHYPANTFPNQPEELKDNTHFNSYGAYELAECLVQSIRDQHLPLEQYLKPGKPFDPANPLPFSAWTLPQSPLFSAATPYGDGGPSR